MITRYLTHAKVGQSTFALQFCSCSIAFSSASLFVARLLLVIYQLLFNILPVVSYQHSFILLYHSKFASVSVLFVLFCSIIRCSITQCYVSRYFNRRNNIHPSSQLTSYNKTAPSFVSVQEARAYYNHKHQWDIRNQFLQLGQKRVRHLCVFKCT